LEVNLRTKATVFGVGLAILLAAACSKPSGTLESAAEHLDAAGTTSLAYTGTGRWFQFGQAPTPGGAWPAFNVTAFSTSVSYTVPAAQVDITRLQIVDPARTRPTPVEQKVTQVVSGTSAWNVPAGATPTPQPQPAAVDERNAEIWATPQGFVKGALANKATSKPLEGGGSEVSFSAGKNKFVGTINARNEVEKVQTWIYSPVSGDTPVEFAYSNYKDFAGVQFPSRIVRTQGGYPVLELDVATVTKNPQVAITTPEAVANFTVPPINIETQLLAPGVHLLMGSHNSLVIDQADHIVVVEGPLNEARSEAVIAKAKELVPGKPIRYVLNTHAHFDHSGGLRTFVDEGATIVTHESNKPFYEKVWAAPHTLQPDRLSKSGKAATFETVGDKHVLTDGTRPIELHAIAGSGHADGFLAIYLPNEKIIVQGDAYSPTAVGGTPPATPNPYAVNFHENIERLALDVATVAPIHGRVGTLNDLRRDIGLPEVTAKPAKGAKR